MVSDYILCYLTMLNYIYKYSNISCKNDFDLVKAKLLTPLRTELLRLVSCTKFIAKCNAGKKFIVIDLKLPWICVGVPNWMERGPPSPVIYLFRPISTQAEVRLDSVHISNRAGVDLMTTLHQQLSLSKLSLENAAIAFAEESKSLAEIQSRHEMIENTLTYSYLHPNLSYFE